MSKIKFNDALVSKAKKVFKDSETETIKSGDGLTRQELRLLERRLFVKKHKMFGHRRYSNVTPSIFYVWEWIGDKNEV